MQWAFPFANPVDVNLFKDYPNVVKQPMDFATIKAKVDSGAYKGPQHFFDDMKLVFSNARRYNPPGSDVNLMANGVEVGCLLSHAVPDILCSQTSFIGPVPPPLVQVRAP